MHRKTATVRGDIHTRNRPMTKARVLCCENCEVRVAHETEIEEDFRDQEYERKRFARCFNVAVEEAGKLVCMRCGNVHYEGEEVGTELAEGTLRAVAFRARPLQVLLYVQSHAAFFAHGKIVKNPEGKMVYVESISPDTNGCSALNASYELSAKLAPEFEVEQRNVVRIFGQKRDKVLIEQAIETVESSSWPCAKKFEWFRTLAQLEAEVFRQTYDFVFFLKVDRGGHVVWTDYNSKGTEDCLVLSWLCSGGNVLFGQHGLPISGEDRPHGARLDMQKDIIDQVRNEDVFENRQETLAQLAERGHFLGWWKPEATLPNYVQEKLMAGLQNELFPQWQFLSAFPRYTFDNPERRSGVTRVTKYRDRFSRNDTGTGDRKPDEEEGWLERARRSSRLLFREGMNFFQTLLQRSLGGNDAGITA